MIDLSRNANYLIDATEPRQFVDTITTHIGTMESTGRNLVLNSDTCIDRGSKILNVAKDASELSGKTVTSSVDIEVENAQIGETFNSRRIGFEFSLMRADGTKDYYGAWKTLSEGETFKGRISVTFNISNRDYVEVAKAGIHVQILGGLAKCGRPKLEKGSTATPWTPAPEDLSDLKGIKYFTVKPLQAGEKYTLFLQKEVTPNAFLGIWIEDYFVGYIRGNSHTFKAPVGEINRIILKTLDELGTIKNARLAGPDSYTHEQVRDMLHMKRGSRKVRFRYYLLDKRENKLAEISHLVENGSIEQSAFSDIKRTAKFKLKDCAYRINGEEKEIDWYSDRIQVFVEFEIEKDKWLEYSLGVFLISTPTRKEENQTVYREVEAYDKLLIMKEDKVDYRHTIFAGVRYYDAMVQILESAGINNYNIENNDKRLSNDKEYDPGTEKLSILNDLASDLNFTPFWVDEWGYFRSNQYRSPQEQPEDYIYEDDELSIVGGGIEEELDLFDLPNVFTVVVANPDTEEEYISTVENLNPSHPRSIQNMGRRVVRFEEKDDIADQESLDAYVERLAFQSSQIYGKVKFTTAIMPFHSYSNVLRVKNKTLGIDDKYGETNWKMNLEAGANMEHEVRRVVSLI